MKQPVILLMGPTASGKTAVATSLVQEFPFEIVSVDSALVFRHMNIGTAKPDASTLALAPHHLIDIIDPDQSYSAGRFVEDATSLIGKIGKSGRIPLLAGGTMLYFRSLMEGLNSLPGADPEIRAEIDALAERIGWPALHADLATFDPETASRIEPGDSQRIQRAHEVRRITGKSMSEILKEAKDPPPFHFIPIALVPSDRSELHKRIAMRFEAMLKGGLIEETEWIGKNFQLDPAMPSMRTVGYRQAWQYLEGTLSKIELFEKGVAATRQLAKRQLTWLRSMQEVTSFDCLDPALERKVKSHIEKAINCYNLL